MLKKLFIILGILTCITNICLAEELLKPQSKYPDYAYMYLGPDKYEKISGGSRFLCCRSGRKLIFIPGIRE